MVLGATHIGRTQRVIGMMGQLGVGCIDDLISHSRSKPWRSDANVKVVLVAGGSQSCPIH